MKLIPLTAGKVSGTGVVLLQAHHTGGIFGGALISTDGTNAAAVTVRRVNASGAIVFDLSTTTAGAQYAPYDTDGTDTLHYTITGTGASAQLYEWAP